MCLARDLLGQVSGVWCQDYEPDGVIIFPGTLFGDDLAARAGAAKIPVWRPHVRERL